MKNNLLIRMFAPVMLHSVDFIHTAAYFIGAIRQPLNNFIKRNEVQFSVIEDKHHTAFNFYVTHAVSTPLSE